MKYIVRRMVVEDLPQVWEIETESFPQPWSTDYLLHELTNNQVARYMVICRGDDVLGYAGVWIIVGEIHVTTIAVRTSHRRQGIGERLLTSLIDMALRYEAQAITLEVRESNVAARAIYTKYGFEEVGLRKGYYSETGENAILMTADNIHSPSFQDNFQQCKRNNSL